MLTETLVTGVTLTVVLADAEPFEFVAVSVYVVVAFGVMVTEVPVTVPGSGATLKDVAPVTDQLSVALWPGWIEVGAATKLEITGAAGGGGVVVPKRPNRSAASPLPTAPMFPPGPSCGSPAPISGLPAAGEYFDR
jgi:hypothetical protein